MSDQELVGLYKAVQTRAEFVKAMSSDESKIVSPDTATDHVVEVTNEIAYPREAAQANPNAMPKPEPTVTEATAPMAAAMREHGFTRIIVDELTFEMAPKVEAVAGELLSVDDEAQAWDRYYVAAYTAGELNPATAADRMLEERRKRFPKAKP